MSTGHIKPEPRFAPTPPHLFQRQRSNNVRLNTHTNMPREGGGLVPLSADRHIYIYTQKNTRTTVVALLEKLGTAHRKGNRKNACL